MSNLPSDRQLEYLKHLGYNGEPPTSSMEASAAIDAILKKTRIAKANMAMQEQISEVRSQLSDSIDPLWLNSKTGVRHNRFCRLYGETIGRQCSAEEGEPCGLCGG